jgi:hypothetical protein
LLLGHARRASRVRAGRRAAAATSREQSRDDR